MPEIVSCPECERNFKVPDNFLGKKVKCPQCSNTFVAKATASGGGKGKEKEKEKSRDRDDRDEDRRPSSRDRDREDDRGRDRDREDDRRSSRDRDRDRDREDDRVADRPVRKSRDDDDDDDRGRGRGRSRDRDDDDDRGRSRRDREDDRDRDDDDDDDRGRGRKMSPKAEKAGWQTVRTGLLFLIISLWITVGYWVFIILSFAMVWTAAWGGMGMAVLTMASYLQSLASFIALAHMAVNLVAHGFNLAVPHRYNWSTKGLAIGTLACLALYVLCEGMYTMFMMLTYGLAAASGNPFAMFNGGGMGGLGAMGPGVGALWIGILFMGRVAGLAGSIVFMFFLHNVALRVNRSDLAKTVMTCFISIASAVGGAILIFCGYILIVGMMASNLAANAAGGGGAQAAQAARATSGVAGFLGCGLMLITVAVGIALFVWYFVVVSQVRGAVDYYIRKKL